MNEEKQKAIGLFVAGLVVILIGGASAVNNFESLVLPPVALLFLGGGVALAGASWFVVLMIRGE